MPKLSARPPRTKQSYRAQRSALSATYCRRSSPIGCGLRGAGAESAASCWGADGGSGGAVAFASCAGCWRHATPAWSDPSTMARSAPCYRADTGLTSRTEAAVAPP